MIAEMISGVCSAVHRAYPTGYRIYRDHVEQGVALPCFAVLCLTPGIRRVQARGYRLKVPICVHYFPSTRNSRLECAAVAEGLFQALEVVNLATTYYQVCPRWTEGALQVVADTAVPAANQIRRCDTGSAVPIVGDWVVSTPDRLRGEDLKSEYDPENQALHVTVSYTDFVYYPSAAELMQALSLELKLMEEMVEGVEVL